MELKSMTISVLLGLNCLQKNTVGGGGGAQVRRENKNTDED